MKYIHCFAQIYYYQLSKSDLCIYCNEKAENIFKQLTANDKSKILKLRKEFTNDSKDENYKNYVEKLLMILSKGNNCVNGLTDDEYKIKKMLE